MKNLEYISIAHHVEQSYDSRGSLVPVVVSTSALDLPDQLRLNLATAYALHHCKMLEVVVRLEKSIPSEELDKDAADAPNITWIAPTKVKYDLWCSVMPCRDDRGVVFIVKGCRPEVNKSDLGVK